MDHPLGYLITYTDADLCRDLRLLALALGKGNSAQGHKILEAAALRIEALTHDRDRRIADASNDMLADALIEAAGRLKD